jgi:hypothetical protein
LPELHLTRPVLLAPAAHHVARVRCRSPLSAVIREIRGAVFLGNSFVSFVSVVVKKPLPFFVVFVVFVFQPCVV